MAFAAATTWSALVFEDFVPNLVLGSNSTIDFNRGTSGQTAAQSIDTLSYANLILSNAGAASNKTFIAGAINVSGSFTVSNLLGTITQPSSTTINYTGSSAQTLPNQLTTYSILGISGGAKTTSGNISVTSSLNLTSGVLTTNAADTVIVTSAGTVSRTSGWVNGNLSRNISAGTTVSRVFHIGDATNYTPLTLLFANVTTTGSLVASTATPISGVANYGTAPVSATAYVNRYWNLSKPASSAFAFSSTYDATMAYVSGDLTGGATAASVIGARYAAGAWTATTTTAGTLTNTIVSLPALANNFILGNCANPVTPSVSISATTTTFCPSTSSTFTATPTNGGGSPAYQWRKNGSNISGATSATLVLATANVANNDIIACVLTANNFCQTSATATSNNLTVSVVANVTPSVSISATTVTFCTGTSSSTLLQHQPMAALHQLINGERMVQIFLVQQSLPLIYQQPMLLTTM